MATRIKEVGLVEGLFFKVLLWQTIVGFLLPEFTTSVLQTWIINHLALADDVRIR